MSSLISVVIPVYNVEKYLKKCVDSVITQTYRNIEIILVDDGSPDNCGEICNEYEKIDSRVRVIHKENGGLSSARNVGIEVSKGEYIVFIDSDDYIASNMLDTMIKRIEEDKTDMVICKFRHIYESGEDVKKDDIMKIEDEIIDKYEALNRLGSQATVCYTIACNKLYKKKIFNDIRFPIQRLNEDAFVIHHVYSKCNTISCVNEFLYYYVKRSNSITNSRLDKTKLDLAEALYDRALFSYENRLNNLLYCSLSGMSTVISKFVPYDKETRNNQVRLTKLYYNLVKKVSAKGLSNKRKIVIIINRICPALILYIKKHRR